MLYTYIPALPEFMRRIGLIAPGRFKKSRRPHGILISVVKDAAAGFLRPLRGDPIAVRGEIGIFGEREGHSRQSADERRARSPYLAICVVGRSAPDSPVEVLRAYLHPCISAGHLMPVDSDIERHTFRVLTRLQSWLSNKRGIGSAVVKPLFDMSSTSGLDEPDRDVEIAREPRIPDFLVEANRVPKGGKALLVVEYMGYADPQYCERKQRTHIAMGRATGQAPVVEHNFHFPISQTQTERDRRFWLDCRWQITGSTDQ